MHMLGELLILLKERIRLRNADRLATLLFEAAAFAKQN
jgi:hypothetical protein